MNGLPVGIRHVVSITEIIQTVAQFRGFVVADPKRYPFPPIRFGHIITEFDNHVIFEKFAVNRVKRQIMVFVLA